MFKNCFAAIMALMLTIFVAGCGSENKSDVEKPAYSADKAVQGYAEMYAFGVTSHMKEAGLTDADVKKISDKIIGELVTSFAEFPLSDDNIAHMTGVYVDKLEKSMGIKTTLKTDDSESPVVTLTVKTINAKGAEEVALSNPDLLALGAALGELKLEGMALEEIKENVALQKTAMQCIDNFINELPFNEEKSIEVECEKVKGSDGKLYWAPRYPEAVVAFVQPK